MSVLPERGMPRTKTGTGEGCLPLEAFEQGTVENRGNTPEKFQLAGFSVIKEFRAFQRIALVQMFEGPGIIADVFESFGQSEMDIERLVRGQIVPGRPGFQALARSASPVRKVLISARL